MAYASQDPSRRTDYRDQRPRQQQSSWNQRPYQHQQRDDRRPQGGYQQRPYPQRDDRRPQGGYNQRAYNNRPPQQRQHKQPGNGNPKTNYLKIAPGSKFTLRPMHQQQVKIFATDSYEELEFAVNQWIVEGKYTEIIDIIFQTSPYYGCSVCIVYRPSIAEDMEISFAPKNMKPAEAPPPETPAAQAEAPVQSTAINDGAPMTGAPDYE